LNVRLCAVTPAGAMVTVPAVPPNTASLGSVPFQAVLAPALAALSQLVPPSCHVPLPPSALAVVSLPSQKMLCACAALHGPSAASNATARRCCANVPRTPCERALRRRDAHSDTTIHAPIAWDQITWKTRFIAQPLDRMRDCMRGRIYGAPGNRRIRKCPSWERRRSMQGRLGCSSIAKCPCFSGFHAIQRVRERVCPLGQGKTEVETNRRSVEYGIRRSRSRRRVFGGRNRHDTRRFRQQSACEGRFEDRGREAVPARLPGGGEMPQA